MTTRWASLYVPVFWDDFLRKNILDIGSLRLLDHSCLKSWDVFGGFAYLTAFFSGKYLAAAKTNLSIHKSKYCKVPEYTVATSYLKCYRMEFHISIGYHKMIFWLFLVMIWLYSDDTKWYIMASVSRLSDPIAILLVAFPRPLWWIESCRQKSGSTLAEAVNSWHHRRGKRARTVTSITVNNKVTTMRRLKIIFQRENYIGFSLILVLQLQSPAVLNLAHWNIEKSWRKFDPSPKNSYIM